MYNLELLLSVDSKMSHHLHVFLLFVGFCNVFAKQTIPNVDTKNPIIFRARSGNSNDYFGHGVAIGNQMAIIGGPGSDKHGQIFKCEFNGKRGRQKVSCQKLPGEFCIKIVKKRLFPIMDFTECTRVVASACF